MADRFANGTTANDKGGLTGGPLTTGFDPTNKGFYHGGDLKGVIDKLDYIKGMGTTAIWLTPSFKNKPVQGKPGEESAGYHGYWITDFTQIDPHLGTNEEMKALIAAAHKKGMKVFFDIITNHTADVIDYEEQQYTYRSKKNFPYEDAAGVVFDDRDYVNETFPEMDPATSFPYTPFLRPGDEDAKTPAWLNDPLMYHNRGDSTFAGESSTYGDFIGLDDLFTERPEVVDGMGEIYKQWVDFGIDGFRIDTVKHVNLEFWQKFMPDLLGARRPGRTTTSSRSARSMTATRRSCPSTRPAASSRPPSTSASSSRASTSPRASRPDVLADFFAKDDWYTDADSNAYQLPTFLGNHDMGRAAMFLKEGVANEAEHLARVKFADSLMFATRGNPVTYYGDEQGFVGTGGDQLAREDMFASKVDVYNTEDVLAGPEGSRDRYATTHPLYEHIRALSAVRAKHPALADGAQVNRFAAEGAGIFAVSRIDARPEGRVRRRRQQRDHGRDGDLPDVEQGQGRGLHAGLRHRQGGQAGRRRLGQGHGAAADGQRLAGQQGHLHHGRRADGRADRRHGLDRCGSRRGGCRRHREHLRADDLPLPPGRHDARGAPSGPTTTPRSASSTTSPVCRSARSSSTARSCVTRLAASPRTAPGPRWSPRTPAARPRVRSATRRRPSRSAVSVPGTHNSEMGCPTNLGVSGDWAPTATRPSWPSTRTTRSGRRRSRIPAGPYSYKVAHDRVLDRVLRRRGGTENISYETARRHGDVLLRPATHWGTSDEQTEIITAPGTFQTELGCPADWARGLHAPVVAGQGR